MPRLSTACRWVTALIRRWDTLNNEVLEMQRVASDRAGLISAVTKTARMFLQIAILGAGAWLVLGHELSPGGMIAASIVMGRALAPVEQAIGTWKQTVGARDAWRRLTRHLGAAPLHPPAMRLPRPKGFLSVRNVSYAPPGTSEMVLRGVTLQADPGEALAIIGPSAAGKSTLARLIVGIGSPQAGAVRLDGAEMNRWDREDFGRFVGYLPQDVELFPGTVRENIARLEEGESAEIVAAARLAGVHEMILHLPNGYETQIGERGAALSGGQRQRIGLARAVYGRPALVVLDEPNSNLDAAGEEALNGAIAGLKAAGSTVVLIAHRPALMAHVDRIAVLNEGQVQMFGESSAVLAQLRGTPAAGQAQVQVVKG